MGHTAVEFDILHQRLDDLDYTREASLLRRRIPFPRNAHLNGGQTQPSAFPT